MQECAVHAPSFLPSFLCSFDLFNAVLTTERAGGGRFKKIKNKKNVAKHVSVGNLFRNIHPSLRYTSRSLIRASLYDKYFHMFILHSTFYSLVTVHTFLLVSIMEMFA